MKNKMSHHASLRSMACKRTAAASAAWEERSPLSLVSLISRRCRLCSRPPPPLLKSVPELVLLFTLFCFEKRWIDVNDGGMGSRGLPTHTLDGMHAPWHDAPRAAPPTVGVDPPATAAAPTGADVQKGALAAGAVLCHMGMCIEREGIRTRVRLMICCSFPHFPLTTKTADTHRQYPRMWKRHGVILALAGRGAPTPTTSPCPRRGLLSPPAPSEESAGEEKECGTKGRRWSSLLLPWGSKVGPRPACGGGRC